MNPNRKEKWNIKNFNPGFSMDKAVEYKDAEKIIKYAYIFGFTNNRTDIIQRCEKLQDKIEKMKANGMILLNRESSEALGSLCPYAVASAGSADADTKKQICRIIMEQHDIISQYDRASIKEVAYMLRSRKQGLNCPFYRLSNFLDTI